MIIRTKAGIDALPKGRIRELAEAAVKKLNLHDFIEMDVDSVWSEFSEYIAIRTKDEQINISYPSLKDGRFRYLYLEFKQKPQGDRTKSSYLVRSCSLVIKQYGSVVAKIEMSGAQNFFELSKKAPQIQKLLQGRYVFDPLDIIPKIRKILGCSLKNFEKFQIDNNILLIENGNIVELGEITKEYSVCYSADRFWYRDKYYEIRLMSKDEIEISVTGKYKEMKNVSISDIRKIADKKRKEMKEKVEKLSTEI